MDRKTPKLLVVPGTSITPGLARYALEVAVRLDLEIIVLFVYDKQLNIKDNHDYLQEHAKFEETIEREMARFSALAWRAAVKVTTVVDLDDRENAISKIQHQDPEIRFVVSDTPKNNLDEDGKSLQPRLTVIRRE